VPCEWLRTAASGSSSARKKGEAHIYGGQLRRLSEIVSTPGKFVYVKSVPWVRIPPHPLKSQRLVEQAQTPYRFGELRQSRTDCFAVPEVSLGNVGRSPWRSCQRRSLRATAVHGAQRFDVYVRRVHVANAHGGEVRRGSTHERLFVLGTPRLTTTSGSLCPLRGNRDVPSKRRRRRSHRTPRRISSDGTRVFTTTTSSCRPIAASLRSGHLGYPPPGSTGYRPAAVVILHRRVVFHHKHLKVS
jgi:hypothetical protein